MAAVKQPVSILVQHKSACISNVLKTDIDVLVNWQLKRDNIPFPHSTWNSGGSTKYTGWRWGGTECKFYLLSLWWTCELHQHDSPLVFRWNAPTGVSINNVMVVPSPDDGRVKHSHSHKHHSGT